MTRFNGLQGKRIILVDDDEMVREFAHECLESAGAVLLAFPGIESARAYIAGAAPADAALIDMKLADGKGTELIPDMQRLGIPTVVYTSDPQRKTLRNIRTEVWGKAEVCGLSLVSRVLTLISDHSARSHEKLVKHGF